ncbi:ornithine carbamoyltransferase [Aminipila terrae]|uniref:Ornithine carbamoyltransferase n=1 Tax=Aminipila terrae TaxID=2697030 RepID=A0A6P1MEY3_9FIRM|nr:ornithine carbamoyltransferase [Aminipila terrae]QHI73269.1 ornithine carbamoyltransferase [Aminipila terrae]QHI73271.1 ornithine carbamoyltransferase [Aminipila terrae]
MAVNLKGRSFLTLMDFTPEEIRYMLDLAHDLKAKKRAGMEGTALKGKNIVLLFEKTSTRTRCAFEVACLDEGAHVTFLDSNSSQFGKKESVEDSAKVFGRFFDGIEYRGFKQSLVEDLAKYSGIPVWNGLTDVDHPTQILADLLTIEEHVAKPLNKVKVVFCGDVRNNMSYAWMYGCAKMGMHYVAYGPQVLLDEIDKGMLEKVNEVARKTGAKIELCSTAECLKGADVLYTDVWASMGEEAQIPEKVKMLTPYKVTEEMIEATGNEDVIFLHCLPSFHDFETVMAKSQKELGYDIREVTDEVFRSKYSKVFDEAENRMHTIKAVMVATIGR